jgi:proline-specific peptidase
MKTAVAAFFGISHLFVAAKETATEWKQWTCDELTPNLCDLDVSTGSLSIHSIDVKYWRYKRRDPMPDTDPSKQMSLPIVTLHGGPGYPHDYMSPLKQLACRSTSEVIFYDQAGAGKSISKKDSLPHHLLDAKYYSEVELPALIDHWKLDKYHLVGHSWGTMLAQMFSLNAKNTSGLQSLTLAGPLSDAKTYIDAQWDEEDGNLGSLPPFVQDRIHSLEKADAYTSEEYKAIADVLTTFFTLRTSPAPDCFTKAEEKVNTEIYVGMQGPSEFTFSGTLEGFNVTGRLHELNIPVLLTHGKYDTMRPSIVKTMEREIKLSERKMLPHSGHVAMIDDAGLMNDLVADFLNRVETNTFTTQHDETVPISIEIENRSQKIEGSITVSVPVYTAHIILTLVLGILLGKMKWIYSRDSYNRIE